VLYGKSTTLYDAIARDDVDNWRFALNASNLFDKNIWVDVRRSPTASTARAGSSWRR